MPVSVGQLTTQLGLDAHGSASRSAQSSFIFCKDSELILCCFHQATHGELTVLRALLVTFLPGTLARLPELDPVTQNLLPAIQFRTQPVDGDAVFCDGDDVDFSWLAWLIYEEIGR